MDVPETGKPPRALRNMTAFANANTASPLPPLHIEGIEGMG